ncbi:hypothetical protein RB594_004626 [Gaeumannomyces avenae]
MSSGEEFTSSGTLDGGFTIPKGLPDGIYSVSVDEAGVAHHTAVSTLSSRSEGAAPLGVLGAVKRGRSGGATLQKRDWGFDCGGGREMNHQATDVAVDQPAPAGVRRRQDRGRGRAPVRHRRLGRPPGRRLLLPLLPQTPASALATIRKPGCGTKPSLRFAAGYREGWTDWWSGSNKEYTYGYHLVDGNRNFCGRNH